MTTKGTKAPPNTTVEGYRSRLRSPTRRQTRLCLPVEIIHAIIHDHLESWHIKRLSYVSSTFHAIVRPYLWRTVDLLSTAKENMSERLSDGDRLDQNMVCTNIHNFGPLLTMSRNPLLGPFVQEIRWTFHFDDEGHCLDPIWRTDLRGIASQVVFFGEIAAQCPNLSKVEVDFDGFDTRGILRALKEVQPFCEIDSLHLVGRWHIEPLDVEEIRTHSNSKDFQDLLRKMENLETLYFRLTWDWTHPWTDGEPTFKLREFTLLFHDDSRSLDPSCDPDFLVGLLRSSASSLTSLSLHLEEDLPFFQSDNFPTFTSLTYLQLDFTFFDVHDNISVLLFTRGCPRLVTFELWSVDRHTTDSFNAEIWDALPRTLRHLSLGTVTFLFSSLQTLSDPSILPNLVQLDHLRFRSLSQEEVDRLRGICEQRGIKSERHPLDDWMWD